ncbi:MAG: hypothetical protein DRQ08_10180 [Candidatus Latescibacterota bacterium]|nr:MAG: hypothetical protein DRQ08_10180 [Candidatus Latescibacterota bacterium]
MKYVVVRYGGYYWSNAGDVGIRCVGASPQISECVISYIGGDGIYCQSGATPIVRHCWIYDNTGYGLRNVDASVTVDATNNWWGDPSGPYHEDLNPDGKGNPVSDNVAFSPWLRTPPTGPAIDTVPPTITSGPSVPEISDTYAVIRWTTDEVSSSMVQYGTTMAYGLVAVGPEGTEHSVMLEGLAPSTTYHFRVGSRDAGGNVVWSEDFTFTTLAFPRLVGDFDGDGDVDFDDFFLFVAHFGTSSDQPNFDPTFDITDDGKVNFEDFFAFVVHFGQSRQAKVAALRPSLSVEVKEGDLGPVVEVKTREAEGFGLVLRYNPEAYEFLRAEVSSELPILVKDEPGRLAFGCVGDGAKLVFFRKDELGGAMEVSKAVVVDASYGVLDAGVRRSLIVPEFALGKVHPNPFNSSAVVEYVLPKAGQVRLVVYDLLGQEVRVLVDGIQSAGRYRVVWDGRDEFGRAVASGVYLVRMEASPFQKIRKVTLVR